MKCGKSFCRLIIDQSFQDHHHHHCFRWERRMYISISVFIPFSFKMSFQLEKKSGTKCYMMGARALSIIPEGTPAHWIWTSLQESRFPEVANINLVWWIEVKGKIETTNLSPNTNYIIYLVFKLRDRHTIEFKHRTVGLHVNDDRVASWELRRVLI
ncbi:hypothetical protein Gohar_011539, partial [Gossypium harknessii]|nr:hypothetical protein [Gossypium harknessii]